MSIIAFNPDTTIILLRDKNLQEWRDISNNIVFIAKAFYYGNFSGYNVRFKGESETRFIKKDNLKILSFVQELNVDNPIILHGKVVSPQKIQVFSNGYFRILLDKGTIVTRNFKWFNGAESNLISYYRELAVYANKIATENEPLYFLAKNYQKFSLSENSGLFHYVKAESMKINNKITNLIAPFDFNLSQFKAIETAFQNSVSVIEGPPGTGKTQSILNLLANILINNLCCAVVSNNNTAIENVYEKLLEVGIEFTSALLGNFDKVQTFFESINSNGVNAFLKKHTALRDNFDDSRIRSDIGRLTWEVNRINELEVKYAKLSTILHKLEVERKNQNFSKIQRPILKNQHKVDEYLRLLNRLELPIKFRFFERFRINRKYKINVLKVDKEALARELESSYYEARINQINVELQTIENQTKLLKQNNPISELKAKSLEYLNYKLLNRYSSVRFTDFSSDSYKRDFKNFLRRYPIILSTTHSLLNNLPKDFMLDYLIIDEASQGDLLSSVLAMSCAKNIIVLGDSKQLQQIDEIRLFNQSKLLADKFNIPTAYQYHENSILHSIKSSLKHVPTTLLREHYRCAPDIINFCNEMFYDGQLIPMTRNNGKHFEIIKTVPGHHARKNPNPEGTGLYNQREIDEILKLTEGCDPKEIGIISPFRYQTFLIKEALPNKVIEADTIHKFQGRQKNHIILSFVVNSLEKNTKYGEKNIYDFVTNEKLLNVAISRAKRKVTAILSDDIYNSNGNIIHDLVRYIENLYGSTVTKNSQIRSVFDSLYSDNTKIYLEHISKRPNEFKSELLMKNLIEDILSGYPKIQYNMHVRFKNLISIYEGLSDEDIRYANHLWTHVDFLFSNKITKEIYFVLEVDGVKYHEQSIEQSKRDKIKEKILKLNNIPLHRFKTNESGERERLINILDGFTY